MENQNTKISSFKDLNAWVESHKLVLSVYRATKDFSKEEMFGLTSQLRRAVISITSNIAEGFSRGYAKEKLQFYSISLGSLTEVENQIIIAKDLGYIDEKTNLVIQNQIINSSKLIHGLMKTVSDRIHYT